VGRDHVGTNNRKQDGADARARPRVLHRSAGRESLNQSKMMPTKGIEARRGGRYETLAVVFSLLVGMAAAACWIEIGSPRQLATVADFPAGIAGPEVVVHIVGQNNSDFASQLMRAGVVKSIGAFNQAAGDKPISAGYYELRKAMPAAEVVQQLIDPARSYRVGMLNVPAGAQLDDKRNKDNEISRGILSRLSAATTHTAHGATVQTPVADFIHAAATASAADLGVPDWATRPVTALKGDHRRIEGLIAPGVWEEIDPSEQPITILKQLISASTTRYQAQGLLAASRTSTASLDPYEALVSASIVEREVNQEADYPKVARVIVNRLAKDQKLQMDSTVNYTEAVTDINVMGEQLATKTHWNTYAKTGLPATPIGAVGDSAISATENPAAGPWLYFVTVDANGTTLFTDTFAQHEKNRQKACANMFLTVGCGQ
jgi:UPF0755 protein